MWHDYFFIKIDMVCNELFIYNCDQSYKYILVLFFSDLRILIIVGQGKLDARKGLI